MRMIYTSVLGLCLCTGLAAAQTGGHRPVLPQPTADSVEFESLFELGEDGTPNVIDGSVDEAALARNALISEEEHRTLAPAIESWKSRVERTVVENIDLAVMIETTALQDFDMSDQQRLMFTGDAVKMLTSAGSLTEYLHESGLINDRQMQQNRRIVSDYQRGIMFYMGEEAQRQFPDDTGKQMEVVMRNNYLVALRDPFSAYHRILEALSRHPDAVAEALSGKIDAELAGTMTTLQDEKSVDAVRTLLAALEYDEQRALAKLGLKLDVSDN